MAAVGRGLLKLYFIGSRNVSYMPCSPCTRAVNELMSLQHVTVLLCRCMSVTRSTPAGKIEVKYTHGFVSLSIPLPSRRKRCVFTFLPATQTISDLISQLEQEDEGTNHVVVYSLDGCRYARLTPLDVVLRRDFYVVINDLQYTVAMPTSPELQSVDNVMSSISQLYSHLNVEHYQLQREHQLENHLTELQRQIEPFEQLRREIALKAEKRTNRLAWVGLGLMGLQFGLLARAIWWRDYPWDFVEPITYFIGYGSAILMFGYYILTRQEYILPDVSDREFLFSLHRLADKRHLNLAQYNALRDQIKLTEYDLQRLRDPLQLHLPAEYFDTLSRSSSS